jgi:hypothetical protein
VLVEKTEVTRPTNALSELLVIELVREDPRAVYFGEQHDPECDGKDGYRDQPQGDAKPIARNPL